MFGIDKYIPSNVITASERSTLLTVVPTNMLPIIGTSFRNILEPRTFQAKNSAIF